MLNFELTIGKGSIQGITHQHHFPGKIRHAEKVTLGNGQGPLDQESEKDLRHDDEKKNGHTRCMAKRIGIESLINIFRQDLQDLQDFK